MSAQTIQQYITELEDMYDRFRNTGSKGSLDIYDQFKDIAVRIDELDPAVTGLTDSLPVLKQRVAEMKQEIHETGQRLISCKQCAIDYLTDVESKKSKLFALIKDEGVDIDLSSVQDIEVSGGGALTVIEQILEVKQQNFEGQIKCLEKLLQLAERHQS